MADSLTLPVPEVLAAIYLVPASLPAELATAQAKDAVARRIANPLRDIVGSMLDRPVLTIRRQPASALPEVPADLQAYLGATPEQIEAVSGTPAFLAVRAVSFPGAPPMHELAARAAAGALAMDLGLPVVDTGIPKILAADAALEALPREGRRFPLARWVQVFLSTQATGLWLTTKGLGRFGLPELQVRNVPPHLGRPCTMALTGLASQLLSRWWRTLRRDKRPAFVEIPAQVEFSGSDVARAYESAPADGGLAEVRLAFDPAVDDRADSFLTVLPPADWAASAGEHLSGVCDALFGVDPPELHWVPSATAAMDKAIATARESLPDARAKFLAGELPPGGQLMVKHRVAGGDPEHEAQQGLEYVWAYVTSWREPGTVLASSADDAVHDPRIRAGRPVVIDAGTIVDWAVWIDGPGIVEGGWTNEVALNESD